MLLGLILLICHLLTIALSEPVCCETKTFNSVGSAILSGYSKNSCETGKCKTLSEKIKHIIVLMLENRSFDHMLGFLSETRDDIDGCIPEMGYKCSNPEDPNDPLNTERIFVSDDAVYHQPADPEHILSEITYQIFGTNSLGNMVDLYPAPMNGFVKSYSRRLPDNGAFIMKSFNQTSLPVMTKLANGFGVIDHWFSGIPGETQPNRVMAMRSHTNGYNTNSDVKRLISGFDGLNIFSMLDEYKTDDPNPWGIFTGDFPNALSMKSVRKYPQRFYNLKQLHQQISDGTLPFLSWVEPSYFDLNCTNPSTSEHGNQHDVRNGEEFIKNIYESLRKSPIWNESLFFIYYDEHGGFFDHVPPPSAPNPDGYNSVELEYPYGPPFDFKRLGVRVPAILISPWVRKGTTDPIIAKNGDSQYCHSSLIHTIRKNYIPNAPPLSKRDSWSLTFEHLINLNSPRTDTPMTLPPETVPDWRDCENYGWIKKIQNTNIDDLLLSQAQFIAGLLDKADQVKDYLADEPTLGQFTIDLFQAWLKKKLKTKLHPLECVTAGCAGELCVDKDTDISSSVCQFKCEYSCLDYQVCKYNLREKECQWMNRKNIKDGLKYKRCKKLCEKIEKLKTSTDVKEEL